MEQHPNPNLDPPLPPGQNPYHPPHHQFQYYPQPNPNPNPNPILHPNDPLYLSEPALAPPGVDPYSSAPQFSYSAPAAAVSGGAYYSEAELQGWAALEAARHFGLDSAASYYAAPGANGISIPQNGTEQLTYPTPQANAIAFSKRKKPLKKPKIIQSAYCGICKVDCNSNDILAQHKLGKKHKKNVEKLRQSLAPAPAPAPTPAPAPPPPQAIAVAGSRDPAIGPQENSEKAIAGANPSRKKKKKKAAGSAMDVESKKRKMLEGGAAAEAVRTCDICNVVCNSDTVFNSHVAGQKHTAMVRKHLSRSA